MATNDLPAHFRPKVPVAGVIKIGEVKDEKPSKLDYFRFCLSQPSKDGNYDNHPAFEAENKAKSRSVLIELISDDPGLNLEQSKILAGRGTQLCRCVGGGKAERRVNAQGQIDPLADWTPIDGCNDDCPYAVRRECKVASILRFRLPNQTPLGHVWQFRSFGWNTAQELLGAMQSIKVMTGGTLSRIPINLTMSEQRRDIRANTRDGKKKMSTSFWSVGMSFGGGNTEEDLLSALERAHSLKQRYAALNIDLEKDLAAQGRTIGFENAEESRAINLEYFPNNPAPPVDPSEPIQPQGETVEWNEEQTKEAKALVNEFKETLSSLGVEEPSIDEITRGTLDRPGPEMLIGCEDGYEKWANRFIAFTERQTKRFQKED